MNFILCPIDFSETSDNAGKYAVSLARETGAKVLFTYIIPMSVTEPVEDYHPLHDRDVPPEQAYPIIRKDLEVKLEKYAAALGDAANNGAEIYYALKEGKMIDAIMELDKEQKIDLIVMGTQGASGMRERFIGSNTAKVIEEVDIPVLAVPKDARYKDVTKILYAEDLRDDEWHTIKQLENIARDFDAEIKVLHVYDEDEKDTEGRMQAFREKFQGISSYSKVSYYDMAGADIEDCIERAAEELQVDFIATQTRKRSFFTKLFDRSLTKKLAYHTHIPLLAMHV